MRNCYNCQHFTSGKNRKSAGHCTLHNELHYYTDSCPAYEYYVFPGAPRPIRFEVNCGKAEMIIMPYALALFTKTEMKRIIKDIYSSYYLEEAEKVLNDLLSAARWVSSVIDRPKFYIASGVPDIYSRKTMHTRASNNIKLLEDIFS